MRNLTLILLFCISIHSCKSSKKPSIVTKKSKQVQAVSKRTNTKSTVPETADYNVVSNIINTAKEYNGVRYKYGGTTSKGMDCSGLIQVAFKQENIEIPRTSLAMSKKGISVPLEEVQKGDLLFFQTNKNKKVVNHVGLVVESLPGIVEFIHATTSKGVTISNLNETYWRLTFYEARRIL